MQASAYGAFSPLRKTTCVTAVVFFFRASAMSPLSRRRGQSVLQLTLTLVLDIVTGDAIGGDGARVIREAR